MTKKDYVLIANILKNNTLYFSSLDKYYLFCRAFGIELEEKNKSFDTVKFLIACGVDIQYQCLVCDKVTKKPACSDCEKLVSTL